MSYLVISQSPKVEKLLEELDWALIKEKHIF